MGYALSLIDSLTPSLIFLQFVCDEILIFSWDFKSVLGRYYEEEIWSRFVFEIVIWPQEVTLVRWTQPSGPLCLRQCFVFLSDPSPIIVYPCHWLSDSLTFSKLDWCDPDVWRWQLKTCWDCYCFWCWWWERCLQQFVADLSLIFVQSLVLRCFSLWFIGAWKCQLKKCWG